MFKKNRRKYARLQIHCLLKYKGLGSKPILTFIRNVSANGALFHSQVEIPVGSIIELEINFPLHPDPIKVVSKVIRLKPLKKIAGFFVAVEFVSIEEKDKNFIEDRILEIYQAQ